MSSRQRKIPETMSYKLCIVQINFIYSRFALSYQKYVYSVEAQTAPRQPQPNMATVVDLWWSKTAHCVNNTPNYSKSYSRGK